MIGALLGALVVYCIVEGLLVMWLGRLLGKERDEPVPLPRTRAGFVLAIVYGVVSVVGAVYIVLRLWG